MDLSTDPSKTHTSQTHLQYSIQRKHLRTKPNLTTNLNLFITKKVFFFSSFALIALKERYRYPPQIWGKRKEKKRSKRRRGALSSFACQLAFFFFFG
jgi:hypothetical protein